MLVYRDAHRVCDTGTALRSVVAVAESALRSPAPDAAVDLLIELGEFDSAVLDALFPTSDGVNEIERLLTAMTIFAGHALLAARGGEPFDGHVRAILRGLSQFDTRALPRTIELRVSEGYAFYALHPHTYAASAHRFVETFAPVHVCCLGIRSIGTSLAAVVAAALERRGIPVELHTVRPHGHPFDRRASFRADLEIRLRDQPPGTFYLVVDEGPGLSGSSFVSVADALDALGVPRSHVAFLPSWDADGSTFRSEHARAVWPRYPRFAVSGDRSASGIDWSGGAWRTDVFGAEALWPAVQPQHEVEKQWLRDEGLVTRFAGLGRYGRAKLTRAEALAAAGLGARAQSLDDGYLTLEFVNGTPWRASSRDVCDAIARHIAFVARTFPAERSPSVDEIERMIATNLAEGLGSEQDLEGLDDARRAIASYPGSAIDGRMLPHEWIRCADDRYIKVDALDHHSDHFFPGSQDAGWDLAAAALEFDMDRDQRERLVAGYIGLTGDRDVRVRLPLYDVAYPAFRLGYATLAEQSVTDASERARFAQVAARCRAQLTSPSAP